MCATVVLASSRHHFTPIKQLLFSGFLADAIIINHHCGSGMDKSSSRTMRETPYYLDFGVISHAEMQKMANGSEKDRTHHLQSIKGLTKEQIHQPAPLTFVEHVTCVLLLAFGPPNGAFNFPLALLLIGYFIVGNVTQTFLIALLTVFLPLALIPQPYTKSSTEWWMSWVVVKYFSTKFLSEQLFQSNRRQIYVAPPHGVFPYGNILAIQVWRTLFGFPFRGLAASSALRVPVFKQMLRCIGIVDASRHVARTCLEKDLAIGISTGGVAEVFETNEEDECVVLKERIGLIKLAIRTGADLVPCYVFGNTKLLNCWAGEGLPFSGKSFLEWLSRKIGFALIVIYGRFGLAIPFRIPVLCVSGKGIPTGHIQCEDPTPEQVSKIQEQLLAEMERVFDAYKPYYGWDNKKLIIK